MPSASPIIIFDPRGELVGRDTEHLASQADLLPTILDLVGDDKPMVTFGGSPFDTTRPRFVVQDMDGIYQMIEGDYALHFDGQKVTALYNPQDRSPAAPQHQGPARDASPLHASPPEGLPAGLRLAYEVQQAHRAPPSAITK